MTNAEVTAVDSGARKVTRRVAVQAPAATIFAIVGDPHRHPELDGSGTIRDVPVKGPHVPGEGARFSVGMKQYGVPYTITSVVTAYEKDRLLEWRHPLGHRWRWELAETRPGTTEVTETFDYTTAMAPRALEMIGQPTRNAAGITATLQALAARFA